MNRLVDAVKLLASVLERDEGLRASARAGVDRTRPLAVNKEPLTYVLSDTEIMLLKLWQTPAAIDEQMDGAPLPLPLGRQC